jgi:hypothetical protein
MKSHLILAMCTFSLFSGGLAADTEMRIGQGEGYSGTTGNIVPVSLSNSHPVAALEFSLTDELGLISVDSVVTTGRTTAFTALFHRDKVILFSLSADSINAGEGEILQLWLGVREQQISGPDSLGFEKPPLLADGLGERVPDVRAVGGLFEILPRTTVESNPESIPLEYDLEQNYPNPFNARTSIRYALKADGFVTLRIYDAVGREIDMLEARNKKAGFYEIGFDSESLSSGLYFCKLSVNGFHAVRKLIVLK